VSDPIQRAQAGDPDAFRLLYEGHVGRIYALCLRLAGDAAHAEELVQDTFVRAWEKLPGFRGESAFGTWLFRIAVNVALAERRATGRREARIGLTADPDAFPAAANRTADPGDQMDLEQAIAGLPPGARAVFLLYDVEGYQHSEIAEMTGIAEGTSKTQLFRARRLLREALSR
jgi:RNA polymerase sigma-70 factor (ECF subfamily)